MKNKFITLAELLLVVAIFAIIGSLVLTDESVLNKSREFKHQQNKLIVKRLKEAIIGYYEDGKFIAGFFNDMGRLPNNINELIADDITGSSFLSEYTGIYQRYKGPYLHSFSFKDYRVFRDAFNNQDSSDTEDQNNFGWLFHLKVGELTEIENRRLSIRSRGDDQSQDSFLHENPLYNDYPLSTLINEKEQYIECNPWVIKKITIENKSNETFTAKQVRIGVFFPGLVDQIAGSDGVVSWDEVKESHYISDNSFFIPEIKKNSKIDLFIPVYFGVDGSSKYLPKTKMAIVLYDELNFNTLDILGNDTMIARIIQEVQPMSIGQVHTIDNLPQKVNFVIQNNLLAPIDNSLFTVSSNQKIRIRNSFYSSYRLNNISSSKTEDLSYASPSTSDHRYPSYFVIPPVTQVTFYNKLNYLELEAGYTDGGTFNSLKILGKFYLSNSSSNAYIHSWSPKNPIYGRDFTFYFNNNNTKVRYYYEHATEFSAVTPSDSSTTALTFSGSDAHLSISIPYYELSSDYIKYLVIEYTSSSSSNDYTYGRLRLKILDENEEE